MEGGAFTGSAGTLARTPLEARSYRSQRILIVRAARSGAGEAPAVPVPPNGLVFRQSMPDRCSSAARSLGPAA